MMPRRGKILIVDDHAINRELIRNVLEREHDIFTAQSVSEGKEILREEAIDLVLLDVMMPEVNGLDWLEELRRSPKTAHLPVILVTALSDAHDMVRGFDLGASDYISKPLDMRILIARVRTQLSLKYLTDEREQAIIKLREAERLRSNLFRIVSHDLKNPLNNIRIAEHILRERNKDESSHAVLATIKATVDAMQQVIDDFLEMVEVESNKTQANLQAVSIKDVINDVLAQYEVSAKEKRINLTTSGYPDVRVKADYNRLRQVLSNLVSNALKYSPFEKKVLVTISHDKDEVRIGVQDEGPGIALEERDQLFKEFARTSNRPTNNESSTGLGLWIVAHLMMMQGGEVGTDFPETGGSIFWLKLPRVR